MQKLEKNIYYFKDEPKEQKKLRFLCGVPPAQAGKLFRVGTAALPQPSSAAPTSLHLIPTAAVATPARSRRRHGPYISRPSPLPLSLHPPARLPPTLRAAAATSALPFQVSASRAPSLMLL